MLDLWFEKKLKNELKGYARLIRFADDFVVLFQTTKKQYNWRNTKVRLDSLV